MAPPRLLQKPKVAILATLGTNADAVALALNSATHAAAKCMKTNEWPACRIWTTLPM